MFRGHHVHPCLKSSLDTDLTWSTLTHRPHFESDPKSHEGFMIWPLAPMLSWLLWFNCSWGHNYFYIAFNNYAFFCTPIIFSWKMKITRFLQLLDVLNWILLNKDNKVWNSHRCSKLVSVFLSLRWFSLFKVKAQNSFSSTTIWLHLTLLVLSPPCPFLYPGVSTQSILISWTFLLLSHMWTYYYFSLKFFSYKNLPAG